MKVIVVAGARPNFMKVAPLIEALKKAQAGNRDLRFKLVHTGQHYDKQMSKAFFEALDIPRPDVDLGVGSGSHAGQTGRVMIAFERLLHQEKPDWVVVVGDVNSTMACTIVAKKGGIRVAHVEAGLRSRDWTMPEEINRVVTDVLCDLLFTTDQIAIDNLRAEGVAADKIHFVGNVMIDTLLKHRRMAEQLRQWERFGLKPDTYGVLTLHRPSNVDEKEAFEGILLALETVQKGLPLIFPIHPRTRRMAEGFGLWEEMNGWPNVHIVEPLGYLEMLSLTSQASLILTDSGGLQEEAVVLGVPCITLRENTERPITVSVGANRVVGNRPESILEAVKKQLSKSRMKFRQPEKWDGAAAGRIIEILLKTA
ncbi:MAG: non-hydrolyzing UDP-N-acetylglucosamine 2-epimerase [Nitrospiria bacterium]